MILPVKDVVFREDLYPRIEKSPTTVQKYAEDLSVLPPIEVNQHNELIDGWHRWTAYKKNEEAEIEVVVTETINETHLLELAIERNALHGLQLSQTDKQSIARKIYHATPMELREAKKEHLAKILSVSLRTVQTWLSRIDKDDKEERDVAIFNMWLACYTQEEISKAFGTTQQGISTLLQANAEFRFVVKPGELAEIENEEKRWEEIEKLRRSEAFHKIDFFNNTNFAVPIYNIWKQQTKTEGSSHFGNSEIRWLDNLLYLYTNPFDIVVDPFAGSGSTIDLCKKRFRRYWVSDRIPIVEREGEIRKWDIVDGLPPLSRWKDVGLVYLDPPYWKQAEGKYSNDLNDLGNMELEKFYETLSGFVKNIAKKLGSGAYIALIIQPTQWNAPDREFIVDHVTDMVRLVKLPVKTRISVPYESQQANAQMVEWAKENKECLVLTREIIVWRT